MRVVVALGGNAVLTRGEAPDADIQEHHVRAAVQALLPLARAHQLVLTHGNGPQVGALALESAKDPALTRPYPLDVLSAQTQGMIGYWLLQALDEGSPGTAVAALITRTIVSLSDPAFVDPQKFVGPVYEEDEARRIASQSGWIVKVDGPYWRRVVASPSPLGIVEIPLIRTLVDAGVMVVCAGGGGIPVSRDPSGRLTGVEAVVDKDATAALLAEQLGADALLMLTDVAAVFRDYGTDRERPIHLTEPTFLRSLQFPTGSMGPKVDAACRFVERTGGIAGIGALAEAEAILKGRAGTLVMPRGSKPVGLVPPERRSD
ncbi:MAG TPA: carbamate kinase [Acidimicrobiales bacterium]|nr:carbamate kinase [Acidimicrobiales bacterium]